MKFIDITNQKFNHLTVLERIPNTSPIMWKCKCDCGKIVEVRGAYLKNGHTKSCGCQRVTVAQELGKNNLINLIGQRFGFLTVIEDTGKRQNHNAVWKC
jgi:hypothetical protein